MSLRIAIVGPGRVGSAMARRFHRGGAHVLGFVGRTTGSTARAIAFCGAGRTLDRTELATAHVVVFATGDADLPAAIEQCVAAGDPRACSLWVHTSGRFGLDVFAAAGPRIRRGALHPVVPMPDAASGERALGGALAAIEGDPRSQRLLRRLCALLAVVPVPFTGGDRTLYHAACSLAANGLTALRAAVDRVFAAAGGTSPEHGQLLADALMAAALRACSENGPAAALSGPVRRGDPATVAAHLARLDAAVPDAGAVYRALMADALSLIAGMPSGTRESLRAVLANRAESGR